ncbi:verrucotoxin subunit beta-like [Alligator mississippiensis]|uniref:verrucotoxin subunit beta-like n=1 Tax=Alligator mississippiensis TaxID=8496 RepID=UPI0028774D5F|nr:verrucotoxin subunit beta-like [Alligator mississippiensis]
MGVTDEAVVEMPALGRPFQVGMLYDCRSDLLVPGVTLWRPEELKKDLNVRPQPKTDFEIIASDTIEDKASALGVSAELKASFIGGLVEVGGSAKYFKDTKKSKQQARTTLQYSTTTRYEQLSMSHLGPENVSYRTVFDQGTATHVVTAVLYGAQAFFVFDKQVSSSEDIQEIQGELQVMIKKIPLVSIEGKGSLKMDDKEKARADQFSCKFHGDFALESNPVTYEDAMKIYATLPKLLGENGEKAVPVRVWLYPLTKLDSKAARLLREISLQLIFDAQDALEQLAEVDMRCNDLMNNRIATTFPEIKTKLQQFKTMCKQHRQIFQKELARILPSIRAGGKEEQALVDIVVGIQQSPFNTQQLNAFLDMKEQEMNYVNSFLTDRSDIKLTPSQSQLQRVVLDRKLDFVLSFTFTSLWNKEPYLDNLKLWLQNKHMKKPDDAALAGSVSGQGTSKLWFQQKDIYTKARNYATSFLDFATANTSGKIGYTVTSAYDEEHPGVTIHLYEKGIEVSPSFEPPLKPLPLLIGEIKHDRIQLNFKPAAFGEAWITGYRVEYKMKKEEEEKGEKKETEEKWVVVETESKQEMFTLTGLRPNTEYMFRYASVSAPGVSLTREMKGTVKTRPVSAPGMPVPIAVGVTTIALAWESPDIIGKGSIIKEYRVEYKEAGDGGPKGKDEWLVRRTGRAQFCHVNGLSPQTPYRFQVTAVCMDGAESAPSEETRVSTVMADKSKQFTQELVKKSTLVEEGHPSLYALPLEKAKMAPDALYRRYSLGKANPQVPSKAVVLVGIPGLRKGTLINAMVNYALGVQWEDTFRFKLTQEAAEEPRSESPALVSDVYEIHYNKAFKIPFSLMLVDIPEIEDENRFQMAKHIQAVLAALGLSGGNSALIYLVGASQPEATLAQSYVLAHISHSFPEEYKLLLLVGADGQTTPFVEDFIKANFPLTYFKCNTSALLAKNANNEKNVHIFNEKSWGVYTHSMETLFSDFQFFKT